jgi:hypothetical protein
MLSMAKTKGASMRSSWFLFWTCSSLLIGSPAFTVAAKAEALCPWVKRLLAAKADDFIIFKGVQNEPSTNFVYNGLLTLDGSVRIGERDCVLRVRRRYADGLELPPDYACNLAWESTFEHALPIYEAAAGALRACFPKSQVSDTREGSIEKREENWTVAAEIDGASVTISVIDFIAAVNIIAGRAPPDRPGVSIDVTVTNLAPLRPGLSIEIPIVE